MSSVLHFRPTPKPPKELGSCILPLKSIFARRYYDHDGTLGGDLKTLDDTDLEWLEGVKDASRDTEDVKLLIRIIDIIANGNTVDMWFRV